MRIIFTTHEEALSESQRIGAIIRDRNKDNTILWDEPREEMEGWSLTYHPDIQGGELMPDVNPLEVAQQGAESIIAILSNAIPQIQSLEGNPQAQIAGIYQIKEKILNILNQVAP